tara:strand:+ start:187 stop:441 length:255 start_codon:yes stop_codon:yes gene_type:complete
MIRYNEDETHFGSSLENAYTTDSLRESLRPYKLDANQLNIIRNLAIAAKSHFDSVGDYNMANDVELLLNIVNIERLRTNEAPTR